MCSHKQMGSSRRPDSLAAVSDQVEQTSECLFCAIAAGTAPCAKVAEDPSTFAFMDIDPGSDGHLLVVPKRHSTDLFDIPADDLVATTLSAQRSASQEPRFRRSEPRESTCSTARVSMPGKPSSISTCTSSRGIATGEGTGWSCRSNPAGQLTSRPSPSEQWCWPPLSEHPGHCLHNG